MREYLSQYSISQIASSNEKINADLGVRLGKAIEERTRLPCAMWASPTRYPDIITKAQEAAAERREAIQQEEAQTQVSAARLERELREARMQRAIEKEKPRQKPCRKPRWPSRWMRARAGAAQAGKPACLD